MSTVYEDVKAVALGRPCGSCGHERVHHFGATDGKTPPPDERRCWVYVKQKRRPHGCPCTGWAAPSDAPDKP